MPSLRELQHADSANVFGDTDGPAEQLYYYETDTTQKAAFTAIVRRLPPSTKVRSNTIPPLAVVWALRSTLPAVNGGNGKVLIDLRDGRGEIAIGIEVIADGPPGWWRLELR